MVCGNQLCGYKQQEEKPVLICNRQSTVTRVTFLCVSLKTKTIRKVTTPTDFSDIIRKKNSLHNNKVRRGSPAEKKYIKMYYTDKG